MNTQCFRPALFRLAGLAALMSALVSACAPVRFVEPLPKSHFAVTAAVGGPLISFSGTVIPLPLSSVAVGWGASPRVTFFGGLHTTSLLYKDLQLDLGGTFGFDPSKGWSPGSSLTVDFNSITAFRDSRSRFWPEIDLNFYWRYGVTNNRVYLSLINWIEFDAVRSNGLMQRNHWINSLGLGHAFRSEHWEYTLEARYLAVGIENTPNVVEYHGIDGQGAAGFYFGVTRNF